MRGPHHYAILTPGTPPRPMDWYSPPHGRRACESQSSFVFRSRRSSAEMRARLPAWLVTMQTRLPALRSSAGSSASTVTKGASALTAACCARLPTLVPALWISRSRRSRRASIQRASACSSV